MNVVFKLENFKFKLKTQTQITLFDKITCVLFFVFVFYCNRHL